MVKKRSVKAKKLPKIQPNPLPEGITSNAGKERKKKKAKVVGEKASQPATSFGAFYKEQADAAKLKEKENVNSEIPKETVTIGKAQIGWEKLTEEQKEPYKAIAKAARADRKAKRPMPEIYVPVVEDGHWWLFVILLAKREIWIVDSIKSGRRQAGKINRVKKLVGLLRSLFERYESGSWILQQLMDNNVKVDGSASIQERERDCGLFVAKQMMAQQEAPPFLVEVNEKTRNQIVSMLFFSFHNLTYDAVWERIDQAK